MNLVNETADFVENVDLIFSKLLKVTRRSRSMQDIRETVTRNGYPGFSSNFDLSASSMTIT
jgi:hypothetical protein